MLSSSTIETSHPPLYVDKGDSWPPKTYHGLNALLSEYEKIWKSHFGLSV